MLMNQNNWPMLWDFYLVGWAILSFIFTLATLKSTVFFCGLFIDLDLLFSILAAAQFKGLEILTKIGGGVGVVAVFIALYNAYALMATKKIHTSESTFCHFQCSKGSKFMNHILKKLQIDSYCVFSGHFFHHFITGNPISA